MSHWPPRQRVLIVDGDPLYLETLRLFLEHCDFDVSTCTTVGDALRHLGSGDWDALLFDLCLGDPSVEKLFRYLGFTQIRSPRRVVAMTAGEPVRAHPDLDLHVSVTLVKPFRFEELVETLRT